MGVVLVNAVISLISAVTAAFATVSFTTRHSLRSRRTELLFATQDAISRMGAEARQQRRVRTRRLDDRSELRVRRDDAVIAASRTRVPEVVGAVRDYAAVCQLFAVGDPQTTVSVEETAFAIALDVIASALGSGSKM